MKNKWMPIETAPTDGTKFIGRGKVRSAGSRRNRKTWFGKTSHVPLYGWCWMNNRFDYENVDLWSPTHWMPVQ